MAKKKVQVDETAEIKEEKKIIALVVFPVV